MKNNLLYNLMELKDFGAKFFSISAIMLLLASLFLFSCEEDEALHITKAGAPVLSASKSTLVLNQREANRNAMNLNWTSGSNKGTNSAIDYTLQVDRAGNNFASAREIPVGRAVYARAYSVSALNNLLLNELGFAAGEAAEIEFRVKSAATALSLEPEFSNPVKVMVTPFEPVSTTLYIIGDAAPGGWSADNATPLLVDSNDPTTFIYEGPLSPGEFKFITTLGAFLPSYQRGQNDNELVYRTEDSQPDDKFRVTKAANYRVTVNLVDLTLTMAELAGPAYSRLWVVGDATQKGWDLDNADQMVQSASDPFVFTYSGPLKAGEIKIATAKDWGAPFYRPTTADAPTTSTAVQVSAGDPDNKWKVAQPGVYKITLNVRTMTISFNLVDLYLIGDAGPNGWNIATPAPMTRNGNVYTYTGPLTAGELKISKFKGDWCGGDWINSATPDQSIANTNFITTTGCDGPDNKWRVTAGTAGNYTITIDLGTNTMTIQ